MEEKILRVENLKKYFKTDLGLVRAVDGISFSINRGETFGLEANQDQVKAQQLTQ